MLNLSTALYSIVIRASSHIPQAATEVLPPAGEVPSVTETTEDFDFEVGSTVVAAYSVDPTVVGTDMLRLSRGQHVTIVRGKNEAGCYLGESLGHRGEVWPLFVFTLQEWIGEMGESDATTSPTAATTTAVPATTTRVASEATSSRAPATSTTISTAAIKQLCVRDHRVKTRVEVVNELIETEGQYLNDLRLLDQVHLCCH